MARMALSKNVLRELERKSLGELKREYSEAVQGEGEPPDALVIMRDEIGIRVQKLQARTMVVCTVLIALMTLVNTILVFRISSP